MQTIIFSFICDDKPGVVNQLSQLVLSHDGNWDESELRKIGTKFTGIVTVTVENLAAEQNLTAELQALASKDIQIIVSSLSAEQPSEEHCVLLSMIGLDRNGIIQEVSQTFSARGLNVVDMSTAITIAPMTGDPLFSATLSIHVPEQYDLDQLHEEIESVANKLDLDWSFE